MIFTSTFVLRWEGCEPGGHVQRQTDLLSSQSGTEWIKCDVARRKNITFTPDWMLSFSYLFSYFTSLPHDNSDFVAPKKCCRYIGKSSLNPIFFNPRKTEKRQANQSSKFRLFCALGTLLGKLQQKNITYLVKSDLFVSET